MESRPNSSFTTSLREAYKMFTHSQRIGAGWRHPTKTGTCALSMLRCATRCASKTGSTTSSSVRGRGRCTPCTRTTSQPAMTDPSWLRGRRNLSRPEFISSARAWVMTSVARDHARIRKLFDSSGFGWFHAARQHASDAGVARRTEASFLVRVPRVPRTAASRRLPVALTGRTSSHAPDPPAAVAVAQLLQR